MLLSLLHLLISPTNSATQCNVRVESSTHTAKYNLAPYMLTQFDEKPYHCIEDIGQSYDYSYCFNLCSPVIKLPTGRNWLTNGTTCESDNLGEITGYCPSDKSCYNNQNLVNITRNAWAYQIINTPKTINDRVCWRLSDEYGGKPPQWSFIDNDDITAGVEILYKNGDYAGGWPCYKNRAFKLQFLCSNDRYSLPKYETVKETNCVYTATFRSIYGCPSECVSGFSMCNGRGQCGFDFTTNSAKCFCYGEYSGDFCDKINDIGFTPTEKTKPSGSLVKTFSMDYVGTDINGNEYDSSVNILYDLTPFQVPNNHHYLINATKIDGHLYYINIGNDGYGIAKSELPQSCRTVKGYCSDSDYNDTSSSCNITPGNYTGPGLAYQYHVNSKDCNLLGKSPMFELIDNVTDYAKGVKITLNQGTYAGGCKTDNKNRQITINLKCPNSNYLYNWNTSSSTEIILPSKVTENGLKACDYSLTIENPMACPYNCISRNSMDPSLISVCNGLGRCAADPYVKFVRCICDAGYTGNLCETEIRTISNSPSTKPSASPVPCPSDLDKDKDNAAKITQANNKAQGYMIATIILAIIVVILVILLIFQCRKQDRTIVSFQEQVGSERGGLNETNTIGHTELGGMTNPNDSD